jgi:hypothetical protein
MMNTGTVIEVRQMDLETTAPVAVEVVDGRDLQARYDRLVALVMRAGSWLSSPAAQLLSAADWELQFACYRDQLEQLRRLGDELRPQSLRERNAPLAGDALTLEVMEMFAAA